MISEVAIFDLEAATISSVLRTPKLVEAPNWMPDGKALIINGDGRLYRVDLADPAMLEIDTGFATRINNDHGISPDGTKRADTYQVYTCPLVGGIETQVTKDFDHCDGPDYTPDGEWIWFNGERHGQVDLWRVRPGGSDLEEMTADERVNWFPHPSPDGQSVLYVAYEAGVKGHPRDHDVELRMMPSTGGEPKALFSLCGGQGTINVPCWAPDSKRFAFVRYVARCENN